MRHASRATQQTANTIQELKVLAAHRQEMKRDAERYRVQIDDLEAKLERTQQALELTKDDYDRLHLAVGLDGGQVSRKEPMTPLSGNEELAEKLDSITTVLADHRALGAA